MKSNKPNLTQVSLNYFNMLLRIYICTYKYLHLYSNEDKFVCIYICKSNWFPCNYGFVNKNVTARNFDALKVISSVWQVNPKRYHRISPSHIAFEMLCWAVEDKNLLSRFPSIYAKTESVKELMLKSSIPIVSAVFVQ